VVTHLFHHPDAWSVAEPWREHFRLVECIRPPADQTGFYLWAVNDQLELRRGSDDRTGTWISLAELTRRAAQGSELLRACGAAGDRPRVLDAMAGWGIDGLVLAGRGCRVTMIERHPALAALLQDLARRSALAVECRWGDGFAALAEAPGYDVVYLDPMFPERGKGALPGKRMQWLAELTEPDARPLVQWLDAAVANVRGRVVLKRRRKDPVVAPPDWQIVGRTVRYDVYRGQRGG
jgi:16S rRNA (guanine1516-N2)-methyltransferase